VGQLRPRRAQVSPWSLPDVRDNFL